MPPSNDRFWSCILPGMVVVTAVTLVSPWQLEDPDALTHMATGRFIAQSGSVPTNDPFTYSAPQNHWSNPGWLGDVLIYQAYRVGGEAGLQVYKITVLVAGFLLVFMLARSIGATPWVATGLIVFMLIAASSRFVVRNHIHAYWLIPLYGLVLAKGRTRPRTLWALVPLGALWANLHGSFPLGWFVLFVSFAKEVFSRDRNRKLTTLLLVVGLLHPLLACVSPHGWHNFAQTWDHLFNSETYRQLLIEWKAPDQVGLLKHMPIHLLALCGLLTFVPRYNRSRWPEFLLFAGGLFLAFTSSRFVPLFAVLAVPVVAANASRWLQGFGPGLRLGLPIIATVVATGLLAVVVLEVHGGSNNRHVLHRAPVWAAKFLGQNAPAGSRLFNPYNAGAWLLWYGGKCRRECKGGPQIQLYIDPRNNLGAEALTTFLRDVKPNPALFARKAEAFAISLAMIDTADGAAWKLHSYLETSPLWRLVYADFRFAVYAKRCELNRAMLARHGFHVIRSQPGLEYLLYRPDETRAHQIRRQQAILERELARLGSKGKPFADVIRGYRMLCSGGHPPPALVGVADEARTKRALDLLTSGVSQMAPSPNRLVYLATAYARLGNVAGAKQVLEQATAHFPRDLFVLALEAELARVSGDSARYASLVAKLSQSVEPGHPLLRILNGDRLHSL